MIYLFREWQWYGITLKNSSSCVFKKLFATWQVGKDILLAYFLLIWLSINVDNFLRPDTFSPYMQKLARLSSRCQNATFYQGGRAHLPGFIFHIVPWQCSFGFVNGNQCITDNILENVKSTNNKMEWMKTSLQLPIETGFMHALFICVFILVKCFKYSITNFDYWSQGLFGHYTVQQDERGCIPFEFKKVHS